MFTYMVVVRVKLGSLTHRKCSINVSSHCDHSLSNTASGTWGNSVFVEWMNKIREKIVYMYIQIVSHDKAKTK